MIMAVPAVHNYDLYNIIILNYHQLLLQEPKQLCRWVQGGNWTGGDWWGAREWGTSFEYDSGGQILPSGFCYQVRQKASILNTRNYRYFKSLKTSQDDLKV